MHRDLLEPVPHNTVSSIQTTEGMDAELERLSSHSLKLPRKETREKLVLQDLTKTKASPASKLQYRHAHLDEMNQYRIPIQRQPT